MSALCTTIVSTCGNWPLICSANELACCSFMESSLPSLALFKTHFKVTTLCSGLPIQPAIELLAHLLKFLSTYFRVEPAQRLHMLADAVADLVIRAFAIVQGRLVSHRAITE